jgi:phospholipase C
MGQVYTAVTQGPNWANTVLIFNRDEWGGFFDTVPPPRAVAPNNVDTDMMTASAANGVFGAKTNSNNNIYTPRQIQLGVRLHF